MGLLFFGLIGFGANGLSGTIRNIGSVGDKNISVQDYANQLNQEIAVIEQQTGQRLNFQLIQGTDIPRNVQQRLVAQAAIDNEASHIGLSVGDEQVREQVLQIPQFRGLDGTFDRDAYRQALANAGQSEREFETSIRDDASRLILLSAVAGGVDLNTAYADTLLEYWGERRDFDWAWVTAGNSELPNFEATDAEKQAFYDENADRYVLPEAKKLTFVQLTPDMILDSVDVDDAALEELYEERKSDFETPERRLVERLVFGDDAQAQDAADRLAAGAITFEGLVEERGLQLSNVDLGDVTLSELGEAGDAVFATEAAQVAGPLPSDFGPALYRVNAVLAEQITPKDVAITALREELASDRARRVIDDLSIQFEEQLAGGATLEDLANESEMELGNLEWTLATSDGIAAYADFRSAALAVTERDFPEILRLDDGGIFALRLDETLPERQQPFEDVEQNVIADWTAAETQKALFAAAEEKATELANDANPADLGLIMTSETEMLRRDFVQGTTPVFMQTVFEMNAGDVLAVDMGQTVAVIRLNDVKPPVDDSEENTAFVQTVSETNRESIAQDLMDAFNTNVQLRTDVNLNQSAINAVHTNVHN